MFRRDVTISRSRIRRAQSKERRRSGGHCRTNCRTAQAIIGYYDLRGAGLNALSFDMASGLSSDAEFAAWAKSAITAARRIVKSVMIYRLDEPRRAGIAALLGATHVGLSPAQPKPVTGRKAPDREL